MHFNLIKLTAVKVPTTEYFEVYLLQKKKNLSVFHRIKLMVRLYAITPRAQQEIHSVKTITNIYLVV